MTRHLAFLLCGFSMLAGCAEEAPPRSVSEFIENPLLLEAAMVRCSQDRAKTRYDPECVNARQAVSRIQAKEEAEARAAAEARSESKRAALRRTQAAAAEARRRAAEAQRLREEAEYLAQFGVLPTPEAATTDPLEQGNLPVAVVPGAEEVPATEGRSVELPLASDVDAPPPASEAAPPASEPEPPASEPEQAASDLESIREELRRRGEEGGGS